jgi:metal transporter CNNM
MAAVIILLEVVVLIGVSAVCSGNGNARKVLPLRRNGHLTLAAILLTNVAAVSATSLVLETKFIGLIAGLMSTLLIVIFGEIMPQALFLRRALVFCAWLTPLLRLMIVLTYPVSKPLQLLLDKLFGEEEKLLQTRQELGLMITEHLGNTASELDEDEVEIVRGALQLSEKRVRDIMTDIKKVFWLTPDDVLDDARVDEITDRGWSRIPILNKQRTTCFGVLLMKDLVDVDFDEKVYQVDDFPLYPSQVVGTMTALDTMFRKFIHGGTHLLPVERDDKIVGIVTIEDLLEEIVGHEIEDEKDRRPRPKRS